LNSKKKKKKKNTASTGKSISEAHISQKSNGAFNFPIKVPFSSSRVKEGALLIKKEKFCF